MGLIKEPKGVDFIINSTPFSEKDKAEVSEFIRNYKAEKAELSKKRHTTAARATAHH